MFHEKTEHAAKGKWKGILLELGLPERSLNGKHGPCPLCGGNDRFRWDNKEGRGTYICSGCGAGSGMQLAEKYTGKPFVEVANEIDRLLGNKKFEPDAIKPELTQDKRREFLRAVWIDTEPVQPGDLVDRYLRSRGIEEGAYAASLRFAKRLRDGEGGVRPCMVALVGRPGEAKFETMHRTFLKPDGSGKAEMASPRKLMPGPLSDGCCVMLSDWGGSGPIGIAEGIETAMAASVLFDIPVWASINALMMERWWPPEGATEVAIFGDRDEKYAGQAAAFRLAHRLAVKGVEVSLHFPKKVNWDWNDVLLSKRGES